LALLEAVYMASDHRCHQCKDNCIYIYIATQRAGESIGAYYFLFAQRARRPAVATLQSEHAASPEARRRNTAKRTRSELRGQPSKHCKANMQRAQRPAVANMATRSRDTLLAVICSDPKSRRMNCKSPWNKKPRPKKWFSCSEARGSPLPKKTATQRAAERSYIGPPLPLRTATQRAASTSACPIIQRRHRGPPLLLKTATQRAAERSAHVLLCTPQSA